MQTNQWLFLGGGVLIGVILTILIAALWMWFVPWGGRGYGPMSCPGMHNEAMWRYQNDSMHRGESVPGNPSSQTPADKIPNRSAP